MNSFYYLIFILTISLRFSVNGSFPDDPKPCKYEDIECLTKTIQYFFNEKAQGDDSINLSKIDPMEIKEIDFKQGGESPVNIDLKCTNNLMYGLSKAEVINVKGFGKDMTKAHELTVRSPRLDLVGDYVISGKVLVLPITGTGKSNISMVNVDLITKFTGTPIEKDGASYLQIDKFHYHLKPKKMIYKFENLFNGDKALNDNMNLFLNENWSDIYKETEGIIDSEFGKLFKKVIAKVFTKYPYDKFFEE